MSTPKRKQWQDVDGIVLLDKPAGLSSNQALQRVRRLYQARKAGHAGSLDPFATGQLPVCFGEATKVCTFLLDSSKHYVADAQFGVTTTTGDPEGEVLKQRDVGSALTAGRLLPAIDALTGDIQQVPPMYSALHHQGQRLYDLARQGKVVDRPPRSVTIHAFELLESNGKDRARFAVHCSKGTYIRTLIEDLGEALGCGAHLQALRRTQVDPFPASMLGLETLEKMSPEELRQSLLPASAGLAHLPAVTLDGEQSRRIAHGQSVDLRGECRGLVRMHNQHGELLGVGEISQQDELKTRRGILDSGRRL
ncbi:MAG: tRNA pseudouridine synthase B [Lysobacteraceae bacterium]|nr:MAG: tRNA pseudouridine synthase B [Xanthomonadaceae bacterium]